MVVNTRIFLLLCATSVGPIHALPQITVDLDLPPRERWREMARLYKRHIPAMLRVWEMEAKHGLGKDGVAQALSYLNAETSTEHQEELMGIVDEVNHSRVTYDVLRTWNSMYELNHPTFCTALLMAQNNGTVIHGRNMDYTFFYKMGGTLHQLTSVLFEAIFKRDGKPHFMAILWPGHIGMHTAMRYGGWSVNVNMRKNSWKDNLEAYKLGAGSHSLQIRNVVDKAAHYEEAVKQMYDLKLAAPMYIILAGTKPYQGVILTMDRAGLHKQSTIPPLRLSEDVRHLVQTNDDLNRAPGDIRRPLIESFLAWSRYRVVDNAYVLRQMRIPPNFNSATIFTTVFNPAMGVAETFLPNQFAILGSETSSMRAKSAPFHNVSPNVTSWRQRFAKYAGWQRFLATAPTAPPHEGPPDGIVEDDKSRQSEILEND